MKTSLFLASIAVLLLLTSCSHQELSGQPTAKPLKIGVIAPLTGNLAFIGEHIGMAVRMGI